MECDNTWGTQKICRRVARNYLGSGSQAAHQRMIKDEMGVRNRKRKKEIIK